MARNVQSFHQTSILPLRLLRQLLHLLPLIRKTTRKNLKVVLRKNLLLLLQPQTSKKNQRKIPSKKIRTLVTRLSNYDFPKFNELKAPRNELGKVKEIGKEE
jgi:hypothetical protein